MSEETNLNGTHYSAGKVGQSAGDLGDSLTDSLPDVGEISSRERRRGR